MHDTAVSYCQGLSYLAAALLLHIPEEQTFFLLNVIMSEERYNMRQLYLDNFETLHVKLYQLAKLYSEKIPEIGSHFRDLGVEPHMFASQWLLTLYTAKFPLYLVSDQRDTVSVLMWGLINLLQYLIQVQTYKR